MRIPETLLFPNPGVNYFFVFFICPLKAHFPRPSVAQFEGSWPTTEGGTVLLRQAHRKIELLRVALWPIDYQQPDRIEHPPWGEDRLAQRVYGLALGYEGLVTRSRKFHNQAIGASMPKDDAWTQAMDVFYNYDWLLLGRNLAWKLFGES